jgi:hypothetical protein
MDRAHQGSFSNNGIRRLWPLAAISLLACISFVFSRAASGEQRDDSVRGLTIAALQGTWQLSFMGITGCGFTTMVETAVLDATGAGHVTTAQSHTAGCGDSISTTASFPFTISHLNPDGSGTGNLSCGPGCGWNLIVQVSQNAQVFSAIDVDPVNPGNFVEVIAIRRSSAGHDE